MGDYSLKYIVHDKAHGLYTYTVEHIKSGLLKDIDPKTFIEQGIYKMMDNYTGGERIIFTDAKAILLDEDASTPSHTVTPGWNDLGTWCLKHGRKDIIRAYNAAENRTEISRVGHRSGLTFKFKCCNEIEPGKSCGHVWQTIPANIVISKDNISMCPACRARSGKSTTMQTGINDLKTWCNIKGRQDLLDDYSDENEVDPSHISCSSHSEVIWKCKKCGHRWITPLSWRTVKPNGCPACRAKTGRGTTLVTGVNDLKTWAINNNRLDILKQWSPNCLLQPDKVSAKTDLTEVMVTCRICGDEIITKPYLLVRSETSTLCKKCKVSGTSTPQIILYYLLRERFDNVAYREKVFGYEVDIYLPDYRVGIEYNGFFHGIGDKVEKDQKKISDLWSNGVKIITAQEYNKVMPVTPDYNKLRIDFPHKLARDKGLYANILNMVDRVCGEEPEELSDLDMTAAITYANTVMARKKVINNLAEVRPDIAELWDYEHNSGATPEMFTVGSNVKVYWKCTECTPQPHVYLMSIKKKTGGQGCPVKSGKKVLPGFNDFATHNPYCMSTWWNFELNQEIGIDPTKISRTSHVAAFFTCRVCGYTWQVSAVHLCDGKSHKCPGCGTKYRG